MSDPTSPPKARWTKLIVATILAGACLAGCGGGGLGTPSRTDFLEKGNAICKGTIEHLRSDQNPGGPQPSADEQKRRVQAAMQAEIDALQVLGAPPGLKARFSQMLDSAQKGLNEARGDPRLLLKTGNPFTAFRRSAYLLGLTNCAFFF